MSKNIRKLFLLTIAIIVCLPLSPAQLSDSSEISLLTCRPGDDMYNTFGHTAIKVTDPVTGKAELYNYGIFDFNTPGFTIKFLRGKLLYFLGLQPYKGFMKSYSIEKRSVIEQKLNLSLEDRNEIYRALRTNYRPENRAYLYDFFFDNCSTRPRDIILQNVDSIDMEELESDKTFRQLVDEYTHSKPWTDFGIDLLLGSIADRKASMAEQMFLPEYLHYHIQHARLGTQPLVSENKIILDYEEEVPRRQSRHFFTPLLLFGLLLIFELAIFLGMINNNSRYIILYDKIWYILLGLGGIVVAFMWFGTDHIATKNNINLLWVNPLFLILAFKKSSKLILVLLFLTIITLLLALVVQELHAAFYLIIILLILKLARNYRNFRANNHSPLQL